MFKNKTAAVMLGLVSFAGFLPLLAASWLSGRDVQLELAEICVDLWYEN